LHRCPLCFSYHLPIHAPGKAGKPGNHSLFVDGKLVHAWSGVYQTGDMLTWSAATPIAARSVKILTSLTPVWVTWDGIKIFSCP